MKNPIRVPYYILLLVVFCLPPAFMLAPQSIRGDDFGPRTGIARITKTFEAADISQWNAAVSVIEQTGSGKDFIINITQDFSIPGAAQPTFGNVRRINVYIRGKGQTLSLSSRGSILSIGSDQTVLLQGVALQGIQNNSSLVCVDTGGALIMHGGKIFGNAVTGYDKEAMHDGAGNYDDYEDYYDYGDDDYYDDYERGTYGGGVVVHRSGIFTMYGGEISGNSIESHNAYGGGVAVCGGAFIMHGGKISGNTNTAKHGGGGGVFIDNNGSFIMYDGEISENGNISNLGHRIFTSCGGGAAVCGGVFTMYGGKISGNSNYTYNARNAYASCGGGVFVYIGSFIMHGGEISGNIITADNGGGSEVYNNGATFYFAGGTISASGEAADNTDMVRGGEYGTFSGDVWNKYGDLHIYGGRTIRMANGTLQEQKNIDEDQILYVGAFKGLNLFAEAQSASELIKVLPQYTKLLVVGKGRNDTVDGIENHWLKVQAGNEVGWVFGAFLTAHADTPNPNKPVFMTESDILLLPDSSIIHTHGNYFSYKIDAIRIYDHANKRSNFSEIKDANVLLFKIPENEEWLYLVASKENYKYHGFISVYDLSNEAFYGDFEKNEQSGNWYASRLVKEYEVINAHQNVKRYGPLLEITYNNKVIRIWNTFHGRTDDGCYYLLLDYYQEYDEVLIYTQYYEGGTMDICSLQKLSEHGLNGGSVCGIENWPYFNKSRNAVFSLYSEYGDGDILLKIFLIKNGAYIPVKINDVVEFYVGSWIQIKNAQWIHDNEIQIQHTEYGGEEEFILSVRRKDAYSEFEIVHNN